MKYYVLSMHSSSLFKYMFHVTRDNVINDTNDIFKVNCFLSLKITCLKSLSFATALSSMVFVSCIVLFF